VSSDQVILINSRFLLFLYIHGYLSLDFHWE